MSLPLFLGHTKSGASVTWFEANNSHISVTGQSGTGKSWFFKGLLEQAALQGTICLILDYSNDFRNYTPPEGVSFQRIDVTSPAFTINPLASAPICGSKFSAQRLLSSLHGIFRMGPRASLALQRATLNYLEKNKTPTLEGLLDYAKDEQPTSIGLTAALEPLELLTSLIHCGSSPISLNTASPGITALGFEQVVDCKLRTFLVELILCSVWDQRISTVATPTHPLNLMLDECQNLNWGDDSMAVRILREGRKYGLAGWFSSQWISNKIAEAALGQAALQAHFRPDDAHIEQLVKLLRQTDANKSEQWRKVIRSLKVGQFLMQKPGERPKIVTVPPLKR